MIPFFKRRKYRLTFSQGKRSDGKPGKFRWHAYDEAGHHMCDSSVSGFTSELLAAAHAATVFGSSWKRME